MCRARTLCSSQAGLGMVTAADPLMQKPAWTDRGRRRERPRSREFELLPMRRLRFATIPSPISSAAATTPAASPAVQRHLRPRVDGHETYRAAETCSTRCSGHGQRRGHWPLTWR